jgi:hypothetical protein
VTWSLKYQPTHKWVINLRGRVAALHMRQLFPFTTGTCKLEEKKDRHPHITSKQTDIFLENQKKDKPHANLISPFSYTFTMHASELIIKQNWNLRYGYKQTVHGMYVHLQILLIIKSKQSMSIRSYCSWLVSSLCWQGSRRPALQKSKCIVDVLCFPSHSC